MQAQETTDGDRPGRLVWQVRMAKPYGEADNTMLVGLVVRRGPYAVELDAWSLCYADSAMRLRDISVGPPARRVAPWRQVEIIHELPGNFDYRRGRLAIDHDGNFCLFDGFSSCVVVSARDRLAARARPMSPLGF